MLRPLKTATPEVLARVEVAAALRRRWPVVAEAWVAAAEVADGTGVVAAPASHF